MPKRRKESVDDDADDDIDDGGASTTSSSHHHTNKKFSSSSRNHGEVTNCNTNTTDHPVSYFEGGGDPEDPTDGKAANAIPIFLKKTYRMIDTCDPEICSWTADGEMFVVKNPDVFASDIIPQYFDHNKFSSFARQLNFYGFRKIQTKPIRNNDYDQSTAKHVTFYNEKFKRGRYDLLREITRSTRGGGGGGAAAAAGMVAPASFVDQQAREMESLQSTVALLEQQLRDLEMRMQAMAAKMDQEIQSKVEYVVMNLLSSSPSASSTASSRNLAHRQSSASFLNPHLPHPSQYLGGGGMIPSLPTFGEASSSGTYQNPNPSFGDASIVQSFGNLVRGWETNPLLGAHMARALSTGAAASVAAAAGNAAEGGGQKDGVSASAAGGGEAAPVAATLPPHPKQKSLPPPPPSIGGSVGGGGGGSIGLLNLGTAGGGLSGGMHHAPTSSSASANILRNAWEDKFFSTLMMSDGTAASRAASLAGLAAASNSAGVGMLRQRSGGGVAVGAADVSGLVALAAAQQQMQQHHAAMGQQAAQAQQQLAHAQAAVAAALMQQRASSFGINIGNNGAGGGGGGGGSDLRLVRQSTAEILLEAAGELGNSSRSKSGGGKDDKGREISNSSRVVAAQAEV